MASACRFPCGLINFYNSFTTTASHEIHIVPSGIPCGSDVIVATKNLFLIREYSCHLLQSSAIHEVSLHHLFSLYAVITLIRERNAPEYQIATP